MTKQELAKEIKSAVEWLIKEGCGCSTIKLDDRLAVCVGWSDGYDVDDEGGIHSVSSPTWCINAGIKVWTSDSMRTDYDWINSPYYEDGNTWDTDYTIPPIEEYERIASYFLQEYEEMSKFYIEDDGKILPFVYCVCAVGYDKGFCVTDYEEDFGEFDTYEKAYEQFVKLQCKDWTETFDENSDVDQILLQVEQCIKTDDGIECVEVKNEWYIEK